MAQALASKPQVGKQASYYDLDNDDTYEKYRGNCGLGFTSVVSKAGGYTKWFDKTFEGFKDNVYDDANKITFGVAFGGLMRDRMKFPKLYTYDYDIILRIVRGEKRFIGGYLSSQEYVYNLYVKTSVANQDQIVSKFLKQFSIISSKTDASIYKDKRRSLSLGTGNSNNALGLLVDRTSKNKDKADTIEEKDQSSMNADDTVEKSKDESVKYEHRVCNAHNDATDSKIKADSDKDIKTRIGDNYSVRIVVGIPDFNGMKEEDESDIIVSFVKDDIFRFQATYLKKTTFNGKEDEKKNVYDSLYKWPKSAKEIFGADIPKQNTNGLLSVFTTVSSTKVDIKS